MPRKINMPQQQIFLQPLTVPVSAMSEVCEEISPPRELSPKKKKNLCNEKKKYELELKQIVSSGKYTKTQEIFSGLMRRTFSPIVDVNLHAITSLGILVSYSANGSHSFHRAAINVAQEHNQLPYSQFSNFLKDPKLCQPTLDLRRIVLDDAVLSDMLEDFLEWDTVMRPFGEAESEASGKKYVLSPKLLSQVLLSQAPLLSLDCQEPTEIESFGSDQCRLQLLQKQVRKKTQKKKQRPQIRDLQELQKQVEEVRLIMKDKQFLKEFKFKQLLKDFEFKEESVQEFEKRLEVHSNQIVSGGFTFTHLIEKKKIEFSKWLRDLKKQQKKEEEVSKRVAEFSQAWESWGESDNFGIFG